ncbi:hypothetical protein S7711_00514 [Stachybotrys chartarum IBT 7711]|uniref:C2H2-type domain-containing protein n=1 Tax=Stachybotrys chartarum (strain CBS 109288 / IBT 7711) TaxID=1280523 RepID=A0A084ATK5_STACB|nr:hypothetical protein S7711_00514 [Stachybotrys chartarum IBT 7711]
MIAASPLVRHDHDHQAALGSAYSGAYPQQWPFLVDPNFALGSANNDFCSPDISSEALGLVLASNQRNIHVDIPDRTRSRDHSSFKYDMKQENRRNSGNERTVTPYSHAEIGGRLSILDRDHHQHLSRGGHHQHQESAHMFQAPTHDNSTHLLSDDVTSNDLRLDLKSLNSHSGDNQDNALNATSQPPSPHEHYPRGASPSPPSHPAPGTVNPMDIMPASTEKEVWYRNEHQFYVPAYDSQGEVSSLELAGLGYDPLNANQSPQPPRTPMQSARSVQSVAPTTTDCFTLEEDAEKDDVVMSDIPSLGHQGAGYTSYGRRSSLHSEQGPSFPVAASSEPSSHNTPSTMLDSPSPESADSSDFRYSASPQLGYSMPSPRSALFRCDEAGCSQNRHHQRYHSKDHKCTYPGCSKGFGTKTHLQRHINDRHEKKKKYHCAIQGCDYSKAGGKAFPRKDNWKRHMTKIHNMDSSRLPEPVEVDP